MTINKEIKMDVDIDVIANCSVCGEEIEISWDEEYTHDTINIYLTVTPCTCFADELLKEQIEDLKEQLEQARKNTLYSAFGK